jgi:hypothetical protein
LDGNHSNNDPRNTRLCHTSCHRRHHARRSKLWARHGCVPETNRKVSLSRSLQQWQ